jgi:acetyl esterase/lipase
MDQEGYLMAQWLAKNGIAAFVLEYRLPNGHREVPLEDAVGAIRIVRKKAKKFNIDPAKVGIMGFSAGGHLAASTAVGTLKANGDTSARAALRPDFAILFYPVITGHPLQTHKGSYDKLLGSNRTQELTDRWSPELVAGKDAPQTLMILSSDDATVPPINSTKFYNTLKEIGIPASINILPSGGHGWGFRDSFEYKAIWQQTMLQWLESIRK